MKEIAKKAHTRIDDGRDENLQGSTNWIRERLLPVLRDVYTQMHIRRRDYGGVSRVSTHISAPTQLRAGHGGIFTCSNSARTVKLAVSLCLHYYVNHNVRQ